MKKLTLLTAALAFTALVANADEKVIYQDNFIDEATSLANWTTSRDDAVTKIVSTPSGSYIQFGDGAASYNGTRHNSFWGAEPWDGVELPESGYTMSFAFNFEQFGNNYSNSAQRNNEIAVIDAASVETDMSLYYGNSVDIFPNYLFKITQCLSGTAAGEGGYATGTTGTCYFTINNESDSVNVSASTWYYVTLNVVGQNVNYSIIDISGTPLRSGSYTLPDGGDNRAGGIVLYQARYLGITDIMDVKMSYEFDGDIAQTPIAILNQVKGNDRVYKVSFLEDETLHYILPGGAEEELDYWDAEDPETGDPGVTYLTATETGTLSVWTTKRDAVSDVVEIAVECGWIKLVDPVVAIASVSEGYAKSYTVSIDNASVLLSPSVALTYVLTYDDGETLNGELVNGSTLELTKPGTLVVTANQIPVGGVEYYERSSVTVENDVEYVVAADVNYQEWTEAQLDGNSAFEKGELVDDNTSHWIGHWMNSYDVVNGDSIPWVTDPETPLPIYTLINDEAGVNYATALLPLKMNTARANIAILVKEGIFINGTTYNYGEVYFDESYITDDPAKPNFMEVSKTGSYDRYDKQESCHTVDIVKTDVTDYTLYRYDTAINRVRVFTYKGFVPGNGDTGINDIVKASDPNAPIYNLSGVRVSKNSLNKGVYIQNGKKFVVK